MHSTNCQYPSKVVEIFLVHWFHYLLANQLSVLTVQYLASQVVIGLLTVFQ